MADPQDPMPAATAAENLLPVELTIHDHYGRETRCTLHKLPAIVGRDKDADVQLRDPWASHRHCVIDQVGNVLVVRDLGSKNGVFIHRNRVGEADVFSGDQLAIGRTKVTVRYRCGASTATEAPASKPPEQKPSHTWPPDTEELLY